MQFELRDFIKNLKLELHILKHRAQHTPDINVQYRKKNSRESTEFDRLVVSKGKLINSFLTLSDSYRIVLPLW